VKHAGSGLIVGDWPSCPPYDVRFAWSGSNPQSPLYGPFAVMDRNAEEDEAGYHHSAGDRLNAEIRPSHPHLLAAGPRPSGRKN
jgi:hypothetical protein